jgi:hypothetical protein
MAKARGDKMTGDLLSWEPPKVAPRFEETRVRASSLARKVCRVLAESLKEDGRSREDIAAQLSEFLGEEISRDSMDAWTSEARENNNISAYRYFALARILGSAEMLNELLTDTNMIVVDQKYQPLIERELALEKKEALEQFIASRDKEWRLSK